MIAILLVTNLVLPAQTPVQNFKLTNVVDGSVVSLESYPTCSGLTIIFTGNACPYDGYYTERIKDFITTYQGKIQFLLVNSFQEAEEAADKMKDAHSSWGLPVPYLADKAQEADSRALMYAFLRHTIGEPGRTSANSSIVSQVTPAFLLLIVSHWVVNVEPKGTRLIAPAATMWASPLAI